MTLLVRKMDGEVTAGVPGLKWTYETLSDLLDACDREVKSWHEQMQDDYSIAQQKKCPRKTR